MSETPRDTTFDSPRPQGEVRYLGGPDAAHIMEKVIADPHNTYLRRLLQAALRDSAHPLDHVRAELIRTSFEENAAREDGLHATSVDSLREANLAAEIAAKHIEELIAKYERELLLPLNRDDVLGVEWKYGTPGGLTLSGEVFTEKLPELLSQARTVDALTVLLPREGAGANTLSALQQQILERLSNLRLIGSWGTEAARAVAGSPHMGNVSGLHLADTQLGFGGIGSLLSSRALTGLRTLTLSGNRIDENLAIGLLRVPNLPPALRELILTDCGIDDDTAVSFAANSLFSTLHHLDLRQNPLSVDGIRILLDSEELANVAIRVDLDNVEQPEAQQVAQELWRREQAVPMDQALQLQQGDDTDI